jgi:N-acetylglutamate synthase-like GNAT family acetyltransferase
MTEIRKTHQEDFADVLLLLEQLWPNQVLEAESLRRVFVKALASDAQVYLSACDSSRVIGFASLTVKNNLWQAGNLGHVDELVVDSTRRGHGVGSHLLGSISDEARKRHLNRITAIVREHEAELLKAWHDRPSRRGHHARLAAER